MERRKIFNQISKQKCGFKSVVTEAPPTSDCRPNVCNEQTPTSSTEVEEKVIETSPLSVDETTDESSSNSVQPPQNDVSSAAEIPVEETPVEKTPGEKAPVEKAQVEKEAVEKAPITKTLIKKAPIKKALFKKLEKNKKKDLSSFKKACFKHHLCTTRKLHPPAPLLSTALLT